MKKINRIIGFVIVLLIGTTGMFFFLNKNPSSEVDVQHAQKEIIKRETEQREGFSTNLSDIEGIDCGVLLKSYYSVDIQENAIESSENSIVITNKDFKGLIKEHQSEETEKALRALEAYYEEHIFAEERLYEGDKQPRVQVFQGSDGIWAMIYDIKCGEFSEYETKLIRYIDGEVNETHLGYSDVAFVGDGFKGIALNGISNGVWTNSILPIVGNDMRIRFLANGHEEQMETGDLQLIFEVIEDIDISEQYNGISGERVGEEAFVKQYDSIAMEAGVNTKDLSENQAHWTHDVYDSYYYWLLESVE